MRCADMMRDQQCAMRSFGFHTTSWTLIRNAVSDPTADSREALGALCQKYWHPVYAYIRSRGHDREQAQDLTQAFFTLLIEKNYLLDADRKRGRFRSFLLAAVKHFLANEWDRANALKRGGGQVPVSIALAEAEEWHTQATAVEQATPESLYERRWALSLLENVMSNLRAEFADAGKVNEFDRLSVFLNRDSEPARYEKLAEEMGTSAGALRMYVHRMRRRCRSLLRAEIAESVSGPEEVDEELRFLLSILRT
jgi:DNA-directed RNA polymerase specialized sigma24 family protein